MIDPNAVFDSGRLLALPTETVYGLAAPIDRPDLIARVFALKGRPPSNPLIVHVGSLDQARACAADWSDMSEQLAGQFWPGPLTLVVPRAAHISPVITAGQDTVALRMPRHPMALALLRASRSPLVAPSANLFTRLSPTCAADVAEVFSSDEVEIVDGGRCEVGIESTIVAVDAAGQTLTLLRPGMITADALIAALLPGWQFIDAAGKHRAPSAMAPGQMREHYRPVKPLTVDGRAGAGGPLPDGAVLVSLPNEAAAAARDLYRRLREADQQDGQSLYLPLPAESLADPRWSGILNRLRKAASEWLEGDRSEG